MEKTELKEELIFFQAWMVRYAKDPKDINLIKDYFKTETMTEDYRDLEPIPENGNDFKTMANEIEIQKGQQANKLLLMRELMKGLEDFFETVKREDADSIQKLFGADNKVISKKRFKAKLIIEVLD